MLTRAEIMSFIEHQDINLRQYEKNCLYDVACDIQEKYEEPEEFSKITKEELLNFLQPYKVDNGLNRLQKVAANISGYGYHETGAPDHYYYDDCKTHMEKISYIHGVADNVTEVKLGVFEAGRVYDFLERETKGADDTYHAFEALQED